MKKLTYLLAIAAFTACTSGNESGEVSSRLAQEGTDDFVETEIRTTTLAFNKMEHDFGNVVVGQDYTFKFIVKNTGSNPLYIEDAKASCGCTVPDKPEGPIQPGKSDEIVVTFTPKPGGGPTSKTITVTSNTDPKITTLTIRANVLESMAGNNAKKDQQKGSATQPENLLMPATAQ